MEPESFKGHAKTHYDSEDQLNAKISRLVELIKSSKHFVIFTGAGISTAANIPDFRGPGGLNSKGILGLKEHELDVIMPTYSHIVISHLLQRGIAKFVVTSNHDDLHVKSGCSTDQVAELFGNAYIEKCLKCQKLYRRNVVTPNLGRQCDNSICGGRLVKTGVRFGGAVPAEPLAIATENARKCDVALVLGSSMTVSPFCDLAAAAPNVAVVSIQSTPVDKSSNVIKLNATCDKVMKELAKAFDITADEFFYRAPFFIKASRDSAHQNQVRVMIHSESNEPVNCVQSASVTLSDEKQIELEKVGLLFLTTVTTTAETLRVTVNFQEEYNEDPRQYIIPVDDESHRHVFEHRVLYD